MAKKRFPTKIIPPQHARFFARERLVSLVEQQLLSPLVWINGPPGAGKTVFTASLLHQKKAHFLWYRMDGSENTSADLFYFLTLAAERNHPRKCLKLPVFTAEYADDIRAYSRVFFRQLFAQLSNETAIVLDNCQEAEKDEAFYKVLLIAVSELPQDMQIYCLSRNRPGAELSRLRLNNELLEIGAPELQFTVPESRDFLKWLNPQLDCHMLQKLQSITQGWATGMVLLAEPLQQQDIDVYSNNFSNNKPVFDYLISEILSHLQDELLDFLVKTALFEQLTAEMGAQLCAYPKAQQFLDNLVKKNLLIERTAGSKPVYTYHPLLRKTLLGQANTLFYEKEWCASQNKAADILINQSKPVEAMSLYLQLQDWPALEGLFLQHANELIQTGRHRTVSQWSEAFPNDYLICKPWLNYWHAEALKPADPVLAAKLLDKCYLQFIADNDIFGIYSAWQAAVEAITISMDDYSGLNVWMQRFDELRKDFPPCPSFELKVRFYATAVQALSFYNPQHAWLKALVRISERAFRIIPIKILRMMICTQLGYYYSVSCELSKNQVFTPYLVLSLQDDTLPKLPRIMNSFLLGILNQYHGNGAAALGFLQSGIELSDKTSILLFKGFLNIHLVSSHLCNGDMQAAQKALDTAISFVNPQQRMQTALYHSYKAWVFALKGDRTHALEENELTLKITRQICVESGYICSLALKAQIFAELSQWNKAQQTFDLLTKKITGNKTKFHQIQYHLTDAWLGFLSDDHFRAVSGIRRFLQVGHTEQILFFFGWRPDVLTPLCILAIENEIEVDFAVRVMSLNNLFPDPPVYLQQWPWPVRIYSFERLNIKFNDQTLEYSPTGQKKIKGLLSVIVALGGKDVDSGQLVQMLWPDADGDVAQQSLETTLHRLRKLIGKQTILVKAGKISINSRHCWLDLWAFEATALELESIYLQDQHYLSVVKLTDRLLHLYRGSFLNHTDYGAVILKQQQLQNTFHRLLALAADFHEQRQENERAGLLLEKGLELEPLLEANYLRLMAHYTKLEQPDRALQIYQQCRHTLSEGFGIPLSENIQAFVKQLPISGAKPS